MYWLYASQPQAAAVHESREYSRAVLVLQYGCFCPGYRLWQRTCPALAQLLKPEESVPKSNASVRDDDGCLGTADMLEFPERAEQEQREAEDRSFPWALGNVLYKCGPVIMSAVRTRA